MSAKEERNCPDTPGYYWCRDPHAKFPRWVIVYVGNSPEAVRDVADVDVGGRVPRIAVEPGNFLSRYEWDGPLAEPGEGPPF